MAERQGLLGSWLVDTYRLLTNINGYATLACWGLGVALL